MDRHAPIKKLNSREIKLKFKPWINPELSKMIKIKNKLFERKKRQPTNENFYKIFLKIELTGSSKSPGSLIMLHILKNSSDKTWEGIRSIVNIKNFVNPKIAQLKINGKVNDEPMMVVNNFFVNVGPNTEKDVPKVPNIFPEKFLENKNQFNFIIAHISNEEVLEIIKSLKNKSTGPSSIPLNLLQIVADLIIFPLCHIINMSFSKGIFPEKQKIVKVIPLHKGGSTQDLNNFRHISVVNI